jgi:hypothetical protein
LLRHTVTWGQWRKRSKIQREVILGRQTDRQRERLLKLESRGIISFDWNVNSAQRCHWTAAREQWLIFVLLTLHKTITFCRYWHRSWRRFVYISVPSFLLLNITFSMTYLTTYLHSSFLFLRDVEFPFISLYLNHVSEVTGKNWVFILYKISLHARNDIYIYNVTLQSIIFVTTEVVSCGKQFSQTIREKMKCETIWGVRNKSGLSSEIFRTFRLSIRKFVSATNAQIMRSSLDSASVYGAGVAHTIFLLLH